MNKSLVVTSFRGLMNGQPSAQINCLITGRKVRDLTVQGDEVKIIPLEGPEVIVPMDMEIRHEAWCLDRGNMVFGLEPLKICTVADTITFPNGDTFSIIPE